MKPKNKKPKPDPDDYEIQVEKSGDRKLPWRWSVLRKGKVVDTNKARTFPGAHTFAGTAAEQQWAKDFMEAQNTQ